MTSYYENVYVCVRDEDRQNRAVIPSPPKKSPKDVVSIRLDNTERADLDRACVLLAQHWNRKVSRGEAIRAALQSFLSELEKASASDASLSETSASQSLVEAPRSILGNSAKKADAHHAKRDRKSR